MYVRSIAIQASLSERSQSSCTYLVLTSAWIQAIQSPLVMSNSPQSGAMASTPILVEDNYAVQRMGDSVS